MESRPSIRKNSYLYSFVVAIILTIASGWLLTGFLGRIAASEFEEKVARDATLISFFLHGNLDDVTNAAKSLAPADAVVAALSSNSPADVERANRLLDRINNNFEMSLCFLMDKEGLTIASSNRYEQNSLVGRSFASRPYFTGAAAGSLTRYFALGKLTHERGYFASTPVFNSDGTTSGVVAVKRNVTSAEEFLKKYPHAYLVSPEGIIFISSWDELLFSSLWPVDEKKRAALTESGQFGKITFEPQMEAEPRTGTYTRFRFEEHYVVRLPFGSDGWTLVLLDDTGFVSNYRLFGIMVTIVFALLLLLFFNLLQYKDKSLGAAKELLKSRDDWGRIFDAVPEPIAIIDTEHRIINMNKSMAERLGISQKTAVGMQCHELVHNCREPHSSCPLKILLDSGKIESELIFEKRLDSDFIVTVSPILAEDGTIEASVHIMHDVSELKRLERALKEHAQRLEFVLEGSNDATWEWDLISNQGILNTRYYEMIEYTPAEVDSTFEFFLKTIHPDDVADVQRCVKENLEGTTAEYQACYRMVTKTGKIKDVMGRGKIVRHDENGRPIKMAGVITDVTEMKRLGEEINRISNLESIGLLSGGLAHDFNNVLNIIYGNITFVKMLAEGNAAIIEPLTDAEEACEHAKELGTRLQAFSQESVPFRVQTTLPPLLEDAAEVIFKDSHISRCISAADDIHVLEADPRQIRQLFENLLTNAKDAMPGGGAVKINIENCEVDGKKGLPLRSGPYICITIQDDGAGIPEANIPKIFAPYFSTKDTYSQRGMGLGLSICHAIMKRHNGQISIESSVGIGTRVTLYLPASVEEKQLTPEG